MRTRLLTTRSVRPVRPVLPVLVPLVVVLALAALLAPARPALATGEHDGPGRDRDRDREVTLLQVNQCLSGLAGCFGRTQYPAVVEETIDLVREHDADVVVLNESCRGDAERVATETGLFVHFSTVVYRGAPLPCRTPGGRGEFGNAVLTDEPALAVRDQAYAAQEGAEDRRLACVLTDGLTVCGTHLSTRGTAAAQAANDGQCAELADTVRRLARLQPVVASGDVNRLPACLDRPFRTVTDADATQAPGIQHVYVDPRLGRVRASTVPATHTDHDVVVATFRRP